MSVRREDDGTTIVLDGHCPVEEAEPLLQFLQATPCRLSGLAAMHPPSYRSLAGDPGGAAATDRPLR